MSTGALEEIAHQLEQLAIEQYTANMIALLNVGYTSAKVAGVDYSEVADSIKERLGL